MPGGLREGHAALQRAWSSLGLRGAEVEWHLKGEASLRTPIAARLRSALGPALSEVDPTLFEMIYATAPPPLWFRGWDAHLRPVSTVRAELRCLGVVEQHWEALATALSRMRLPAAGGGTVATERVTVRWLGGGGTGFGPLLVPQPELPLAAADCLVVAETPLQLVERGRVLLDVPSPALLARSAGERLRQLSARWGEVEGVAGAVGSAVRECRTSVPDWARTTVAHQRRLSSRSGEEQWMGGVRGEFAYRGMPASGLSLLAFATELGIGKDVSMGCGAIRLLIGTGRFDKRD